MFANHVMTLIAFSMVLVWSLTALIFVLKPIFLIILFVELLNTDYFMVLCFETGSFFSFLKVIGICG